MPTKELPRIGMQGSMQELYDEMTPCITEHQAEFSRELCAQLAPAAEVVFTRPARNRADIEEIVKDLVGRDLDGIMIVMLTNGPAMRTLRALEGEHFRLAVSRGEVLDTPELPLVQMPYFHFRPDSGMRPFLTSWLRNGGTHHFCLNLGDHVERWRILAELLDIDYVAN
jgi:L-arabinose isomerase